MAYRSPVHILKLFRLGILILTLCYLCYYVVSISSSLNRTGSELQTINQRRLFAVFGCSTPNNNSHRGFDYAFYLPLTVVAWRRIGFESVVLIVGEKDEWQRHPVLSHVLKALADLKTSATVLFIPADEENRSMLSQTARIFAANMAAFPGRSGDLIMTTDADLWPLRREHFYQPAGIDRPLTLVHSDCCGQFTFNGRSYRMLPMSHIGASVAVWRQMVNVYPSSSSPLANDSATILMYLAKVFGRRVYKDVQFASDDWYFDQKLISIRADEWIRRRQSAEKENVTFELSDDDFYRIDRDEWKPDQIPVSLFPKCFDVHLIRDGFLPHNWITIQIILNYMYSNSDAGVIDWCNRYANEFYNQFIELDQ